MNFIKKAKDFLGLDIKEEQYALVDDPIFGKVSKEKKPQTNGYEVRVGTVV